MSYSLSSSASGSFPSSASGSASASGSGFASISGSYALGSASGSASVSARFSRASNRGGNANCGGDCGDSNVVSQVEKQIVNASQPIELSGGEQLSAGGLSGIHVNRPELDGWNGKLPLSEYQVYEDPNPEIIKKKNAEKIKYIQDVQVRYFKPPAAPKPGDIIVKQQKDTCTTPAPPIVLRQTVEQAKTPEPIVVREAPPCPPKPIPGKTISVPGKKIPPPPRKVVLEKLPPAPPKPQPVIIERWLPYDAPAKQKVIYDKPCPLKPPCPPKNLIIEWEQAQVEIEKNEIHLDVVEADPVEYRRKYQFNKQRNDLPEVVTSIKSKVSAPAKAADSVPELEGDVAALKLVDLDKEGLSHYKSAVSSISGEPTSSTGCGASAPTPAPTPAPAPCGCNAGNAFSF